MGKLEIWMKSYDESPVVVDAGLTSKVEVAKRLREILLIQQGYEKKPINFNPNFSDEYCIYKPDGTLKVSYWVKKDGVHVKVCISDFYAIPDYKVAIEMWANEHQDDY